MKMHQGSKNSKRVRIFGCFIIAFFLIAVTAAAQIEIEKQQVNKQQKKKIIKKISTLIQDNYIFPDRGEVYGKAFLEQSKTGKYDSIEDAKQFGEIVTSDLHKITGDKHFGFRLMETSDLNQSNQGSLHHPVRYYRLGQKEHTGLVRLDWMEGNIGYANFCRFYSGAESEEMITLAMKFLSNANTIIFDVRENGGGSGDILFYLCSYFFEYPTQLNSYYTRQEDFTQEYWTTKEIVGERLLDIPLFVLTSENTFSAAESFAFDMKVRERAVIVGDSTGGGAHSNDLFPIDDRFEIYIPTGRSFNPLTGEDWEGTGVIPDVLVPAESALDTALVLAKEAASEYGKKKDVKIKQAVLHMQAQLDRAESLFQNNHSESAAAALDSAFQTGLEADLINEFFMYVLVYDYGLKKLENMQIGVSRKYIELYPESIRAYESMGLSYYTYNRKELALPYFEKVLELDPLRSLSLKMVDELKE